MGVTDNAKRGRYERRLRRCTGADGGWAAGGRFGWLRFGGCSRSKSVRAALRVEVAQSCMCIAGPGWRPAERTGGATAAPLNRRRALPWVPTFASLLDMARPTVAMCVVFQVLLSTMTVRLAMAVVWYP